MSCTPQHAARLVASFSDIDASPYLPAVACPTLVLHTRGDMCAPFDEGLFIASSIPGARLVPLETRSHVPTPGEPSFDRVIEEIEAFVGATRGRQGRRSPSLTRRERQILEHIARGLDNAQIAAHLDLSEKTVRNHITSIFDKIGVENRAQAIVQAREAGLADERRDGRTGTSVPGFRIASVAIGTKPGPRPHAPRARFDFSDRCRAAIAADHAREHEHHGNQHRFHRQSRPASKPPGRPATTRSSAPRLQIVGETLCEALDLRSGAQRARRRRRQRQRHARGGASLVRRHLDRLRPVAARGRAQARGRPKATPSSSRRPTPRSCRSPTASFDAVLSTFGVMFTPNQEQAARELARVCKPGGKIGLANWTPESFIGQLFKTIGKYVPPAAGVQIAGALGNERAARRALRREREEHPHRPSASSSSATARRCTGSRSSAPTTGR